MDKPSYTNMAKVWQYAEAHASELESETLRKARTDAEEAGLPQGSAAQAQLLNFITHTLNATSIINVGTGALIDTMQLVEGLHGAGQLTAVDSSARGITMIRNFFAEISDTADNKTTLRAVNTSPAVFLPRLNAGTYDLIVVSGVTSNYAPSFEQAANLLKTGGRIIFTDMLGVASQDSDKPNAMNTLLTDVEEDERFEQVLTPTGTGMLIAAKR
ncbi:O-methyltransferase [Bifidobacterium commune]|uniref:Predicted O-methyltransferase YrrM n=1 Tax=Bifidobacterium commune TaxID=1505727 RepID=A0A1C4H2P9_9BIFI|nr:methyltransferase [Bifidobacterium commune]SCC79259.1 Predicted O-methyltransferase YrrM [Bifidobacterium commune]